MNVQVFSVSNILHETSFCLVTMKIKIYVLCVCVCVYGKCIKIANIFHLLKCKKHKL